MNIYTLQRGDHRMGIAEEGNSITLPNDELLKAVGKPSGES